MRDDELPPDIAGVDEEFGADGVDEELGADDVDE